MFEDSKCCHGCVFRTRASWFVDWVLGKREKGIKSFNAYLDQGKLQQPRGEDQSSEKSCHYSQISSSAAQGLDNVTQIPPSQGLAALTSLRHAKRTPIYLQTKSVLANRILVEGLNSLA